jgi:hypothetical protein
MGYSRGLAPDNWRQLGVVSLSLQCVAKFSGYNSLADVEFVLVVVVVVVIKVVEFVIMVKKIWKHYDLPEA